MKKIWKKPIAQKVSIRKITLSGSKPGVEKPTITNVRNNRKPK